MIQGPRPVRWAGVAALSLLPWLAASGRATASQVLYLNGSYNTTSITFTDSYGSHTETGGGVIGGSLNGNTLTYLYCLEWQRDVLVPNTYGNSLVSTSQIHGGSLPIGTGTTDPAKDVAWLVVNEAPLAGDANQQAGLQALFWSLVTPNFTLSSSNNSELKNAFYTYRTALNNAKAGGLPDDTSLVAFISPSTDGDRYDVNQALIGYTPGERLVASPEPASLVAALSGLIPLAVVGLVRHCRRRAAG
jgi:hypothetical protein